MWQTISEIPVVKRRTRRADKDAAAKRTEALRQGGQMRGGKADRGRRKTSEK